MATNPASNFSGDLRNYIQQKTLRLAQRTLVAYQFGQPLKLDTGYGVTYQATRFNRIPLPYAPLAEGVPPVGETMTISTVTATAQQWGDKVLLTDVAELTITHPPFQQAIKLVGLQVAETKERNTFNALMAGTQVNYVNSRGSRAALIAGDVIDTTTVIRTTAALATLGAPMFGNPSETNIMKDAKAYNDPNKNPGSAPHYVGIVHTLVAGDWLQNSTVVLAASYSAINKLYNYEIGMWASVRFCQSNMIPSFTGVAAINGSATTGGSLATGTYYVQVTASDTQNQYESRIYQVSSSASVTGPNGAISVILPALSGFTFNVYVGTTTSPANLGLTTAGPTSGPMQGQATQIAPGQTILITNTGVAQVPPAAPATGVTVYPTFIFGEDAYGQVTLDGLKTFMLTDAEKADPLNQTRVVGWKLFYGTILLNQSFMARIESTSAMSSSFG